MYSFCFSIVFAPWFLFSLTGFCHPDLKSKYLRGFLYEAYWAWLLEVLLSITAMQLRWRKLECKGVKFWYIRFVIYEINIIRSGLLRIVYWIRQATILIRQNADQRDDDACGYIRKKQSDWLYVFFSFSG